MNQLIKGAALTTGQQWGDSANGHCGEGRSGLFQGRRVGKFEPPFYGFHLVSTHRILDYLANPVVPKLTSVSAPPGYGKTTFLTRLYREWVGAGHSCVWVSLDESDKSVAALLDLLDRAIALVSSHIGEAYISSEQDVPGHLDGILRRLTGLKDPVLFIDNLHLCPDPGLVHLLDALIFATGGMLRLVLASSAELPFDADRARLELAAIEIGQKDLSFDALAVEAVFEDAGMGKLSPETVQLILAKTEGWPAAIRLVQAVMAEEPDSEGALRRFTGSDADLASMLNKRLFASFDADLVSFLLDLAPLRIFSVELAVATTRHPRAAEWIRYLVHRNALISTLDRHRTWFRFHALFRDFLLAEGIRRGLASQRTALLERAAKWCFSNGHSEDAANYALAAPAPALVADILENTARMIVSERGDLGTYMGWVSRACELGVEIGLETEFWYAWALTFSRRTARAQRHAQHLEERLLTKPQGTPRTADLLRRLELLKVMLSLVSDDMESAWRGAVDWLKVEKGRSPIFTFTAALAAATALLPEQNYTQVRRYLQLAQSFIGQIAGGHSHAWMAVTKALLDLEQGNPISAEQTLAAAQEQAIDLIGPNARMVGMLAMLRARAIYDLGRCEEARSILLASLTLGAGQGFVETTRHGLEAAIALSDGQTTGPLGIIELEAIASDGPLRLRRTFAVAQIRRLCALGEISRAQELADYAEIDGSDPVPDCLPSEALAITLARIDLMSAHGRIKPAQKLAEQALREVTALERRREIVDLHLTLARLHMLMSDQRSAVRSLSRALTLAASRGLVSPFMQHQRTFKEILATARLKDLALTLTEQLRLFEIVCARTGASVNATNNTVTSGSDVEVLTPREIEMLSILEAGPSNQQIADQLLVSVQTVKWHLYNLYAKLGVKNRAAALAKARSLNLLPH
jgi:LuxR family maltose regulon positive regulatory protein